MSLLEQFAVAHLGRVEVLAEPRSRSAVSTLHVQDDAGRDWFVKQAPHAVAWANEAMAYENWKDHPRVGRLLARDPEDLLLLVQGCPGRRPGSLGPRVMRSAGRTLRQLHETPVLPTWSSVWRDHLVRQVSAGLERMRLYDIPVNQDFILARVDEALASGLPETLTHGDFLPANWRWSVEHGLHTFDFGEAGLRPAAFDVSRVRHACLERPQALERFMTGYGRALTEEEERLVMALLPWRGMVSVDLGTRNRLPRLVERGLATLRRTTPLSVR